MKHLAVLVLFILTLASCQRKESKQLLMAKNLYEDDRKMFDYYTAPYDKIYLEQIEKALEQSQ